MLCIVIIACNYQMNRGYYSESWMLTIEMCKGCKRFCFYQVEFNISLKFWNPQDLPSIGYYHCDLCVFLWRWISLPWPKNRWMLRLRRIWQHRGSGQLKPPPLLPRIQVFYYTPEGRSGGIVIFLSWINNQICITLWRQLSPLVHCKCIGEIRAYLWSFFKCIFFHDKKIVTGHNYVLCLLYWGFAVEDMPFCYVFLWQEQTLSRRPSLSTTGVYRGMSLPLTSTWASGLVKSATLNLTARFVM